MSGGAVEEDGWEMVDVRWMRCATREGLPRPGARVRQLTAD